MTTSVTDASVHRAPLRELDPVTLYRMIRLRQDVFVLEQGITEADLDGRELEEGAELLWIEQEGEVLGQLRILAEPDGALRIGRLAVRADARRGGLGRRLMARAIALAGPGRLVRIDAQAHLEDWYASQGFQVTGPLFLEAGIEHVPMQLRAG
ncbi:GNAT family N-acetyltransferase [Brachybacterium hainanense]|uniref:GNAT family N-acetyltransferase n=1 Tax=Brachybacterium hainanense TaxID=1541174 RepID=A0ABV6RC68_9MICO